MLPISAALTFILSGKKRPPRRRLEPRLPRGGSRAGRSVTPAPPAHSHGPHWERRSITGPRPSHPRPHPPGAPETERAGGPLGAAAHTWQLFCASGQRLVPPPFGPRRFAAGGWGAGLAALAAEAPERCGCAVARAFLEGRERSRPPGWRAEH